MMALLSAPLLQRPVPARHSAPTQPVGLTHMLDAHFHFGGKSVVIGAEPDHALALASMFSDMGAPRQYIGGLSPTPGSCRREFRPSMSRWAISMIWRRTQKDVDLIVTRRMDARCRRGSRPAAAARRLSHLRSARTRACDAGRLRRFARDTLFEIANIFLAEETIIRRRKSLNPFRACTQRSRDMTPPDIFASLIASQASPRKRHPRESGSPSRRRTSSR